jgi:arginyl-tRNA synthetase
MSMKKIADHLRDIAASLHNEPLDIELTRPEPEFGDYSSNIAMRLAKTLQQNPRELAQTIATQLQEKLGKNYAVSVAGPGFINIAIPDSDILTVLASAQTEKFGHNTLFADKTVMVEGTDPNPFKEIHIGHVYSNTIGESIRCCA